VLHHQRSHWWQIEHLTANITHHRSVIEIVTAAATTLGLMVDDGIGISHSSEMPARVARLLTRSFP